MHVFVSHAPEDRDVAGRLRADLAGLGAQVVLDGGTPSGPRWWDGVVSRIQRCETFAFVLSPSALGSPGCMAELRYARQLSRPILAVRARPMDLPPELRDAAKFDANTVGPDRVRLLRATLATLPQAPQLPAPLPRPPLVPYLAFYHEQLDQPSLDRTSQYEILAELRQRLRVEGERIEVWGLLTDLRTRADIAPGVSEEVEKVLAPGWQPDPDGRVDSRYWDGQAWTTLVRHDGREFNERRAALPETRWPEDEDPAVLTSGKRRRWLIAGGVTVLVLAFAVGSILYFADQRQTPTLVARTFVDSVNVQDTASVTKVTCEQDRDRTDQVLLAGGFRLTLESVDESVNPPTFSVLATDLSTGKVDQRTFPLVDESGEWRVCSL